MCEVDCVQCINDMCICEPHHGGFGEGVNLNGCHLNEQSIETMWYVAFAVSIVGASVCSALLLRWFRRAGRRSGIDWAKVAANRNFKLLCGFISIEVWYLLIAAIRVFASSYAFNDVPATILFVLAHISMFINCELVVDLCHDTLVSVLIALGAAEGLPERGPWVRTAYVILAIVPYLPCLASPALDWHDRKMMVKYSLLVLPVVATIAIVSVCILGEKAMKLLKSAATEATVSPRRRIRLLLMMFYIAGIQTVVVHGLVFYYQDYYPWFLPVYAMSMCIATAVTPFFLSYDPSHIRLEPKVGASKSSMHTTHSPRRIVSDTSANTATSSTAPQTLPPGSIPPGGSVPPLVGETEVVVEKPEIDVHNKETVNKDAETANHAPNNKEPETPLESQPNAHSKDLEAPSKDPEKIVEVGGKKDGDYLPLSD